MPRFHSPSFVPSLKDAKYWSLEWIKENEVQGPFHYVILQKAIDGGYTVHGEYATATDAFNDRRLLVEELGTRSLFLRAVRVEVVAAKHPDSREDVDCWRDALYTGDTSLVPAEQLPAFRLWAARQHREEIPF